MSNSENFGFFKRNVIDEKCKRNLPLPLRPTNLKSLNLATWFFITAVQFRNSAHQFSSLPAFIVTIVPSPTSANVTTLNATGSVLFDLQWCGSDEHKIYGLPVRTEIKSKMERTVNQKWWLRERKKWVKSYEAVADWVRFTRVVNQSWPCFRKHSTTCFRCRWCPNMNHGSWIWYRNFNFSVDWITPLRSGVTEGHTKRVKASKLPNKNTIMEIEAWFACAAVTQWTEATPCPTW